MLVFVSAFAKWLQNLNFFSKLNQFLINTCITGKKKLSQMVNKTFGKKINLVWLDSFMLRRMWLWLKMKEREGLLEDRSLELELLRLEVCVECDLSYQQHSTHDNKQSPDTLHSSQHIFWSWLCELLHISGDVLPPVIWDILRYKLCRCTLFVHHAKGLTNSVKGRKQPLLFTTV